MDLEKNQMNSDNLYKEETFTDQSVGSIRQLTPVKADGSIDSSRDILFFGSAQIMTYGASAHKFRTLRNNRWRGCR